MFGVIAQRAEKDLSELDVEHKEPKRELQPESPSNSFQSDRAPIGGEQIGEADYHRDAEHSCQTSHATNLFPSRGEFRRRESIAHRHPETTRPDSEMRKKKSALPTDRTPNQHRLELRLIRLDAITRRDHRLRLSQPSVVIVMDRHQRRALRDAVADAPVKFQRDAIIDGAFFRFAPATQNRQRQPQLFALDAVDKSIAGSNDVHPRSCGW